MAGWKSTHTSTYWVDTFFVPVVMLVPVLERVTEIQPVSVNISVQHRTDDSFSAIDKQEQPLHFTHDQLIIYLKKHISTCFEVTT